MIFLILGCIQVPDVEKVESCPKDYILVNGGCCLDLDDNRVCDEGEAIVKALNYITNETKCRTPEITDSRHPEFCCMDLDNDKVCDYVKDLN